MIRVARPLALVAVLTAALPAGPAQAELSGEHARDLVGVFFNACVKHLEDNWEGLGKTMQEMGFSADPRPEVRKSVLGEAEGDVWSAQSQAGIVFVSFADPSRICAMDLVNSNADPDALEKEFNTLSDELLEAVSGNEGAQVDRQRDSGEFDAGGKTGKMDYVSYLFTTHASQLAIYMELATSPNPDVQHRGRMSISYVPVQQQPQQQSQPQQQQQPQE